MKQFRESVYRITKKIPRGKVATYKAVASAAGRPKAYRAIGNILNRNPHASLVPCHRVINSDGRVGGYAGGVKKKIKLLKKEGVQIKGGRVDLKKFGFTPQQSQLSF